MKKMQKLIITISLLFYLTMGYSQDWQIVWQDEFNNGISSDWVFETGNGGWGNNESQYYTNRPENVIVQDGLLKIKTLKEGKILSKGFFQLYDKFYFENKTEIINQRLGHRLLR